MQTTTDRDGALWTYLKAGSQKALSDLFLYHADSMYSYGFLLCQDKEKVEDCLQDLFFQLWQNHRKLPLVKNVKTYLIIALRNKIQSTFRSRSLISIQEVEDGELEGDASFEQRWIDEELRNDKSDLLHRFLQTLPNKMKQAIYLRYFENLDYSDIARVMNIRRQVAINTVHRAITHLRKFSKHYAGLTYFLVVSFIL